MATNGTKELEVKSSVKRTNYFFGQLLTERDLRDEQSYQLRMRRLMQREMFGTGTVAGLRIDRQSDEPGILGILVRAGLAIDPDGRELLLEADQCIEVVEAALPEQTAQYLVSLLENTAAAIATAVASHWGEAFDANALLELRLALKDFLAAELPSDPEEITDPATDEFPNTKALLIRLGAKPVGFELKPGQRLSDYLFDRLTATTYIGVRYIDRPSDLAPAVLEQGCCGSQACQPSRAAEGVCLVASSTPFPSITEPYLDARAVIERALQATLNPPEMRGWAPGCQGYLAQYMLDPASWRGILPEDSPCASDRPVVPIGVVLWARLERNSADSRLIGFDNSRYRPLAPGASVLRGALEAITQCLPQSGMPPRIDLLSPKAHTTLEFTGASTVLRARCSSRLADLDSGCWRVEWYPHAGQVPDHAVANGPLGSLLSVVVAKEANAYGSEDITLTITKTGAPKGTLVWRLNVEVEAEPITVKSKYKGTDLDGEPRFPPQFQVQDIVPTGRNQAGSAFIAAFYIDE